MENLELVIISSLVLFAITKYLQHTTEQALNKRWKFVEFIEKMDKDDSCSEDFKDFIRFLFVDSMDKNFLPKMVFGGLFLKFFQRRTYEIGKETFTTEVLSNEKERKTYNEAFLLLLQINFYNAPHWFIIFGIIPAILVLVISIFAKVHNFINVTMFETLVFANHSKSKLA